MVKYVCLNICSSVSLPGQLQIPSTRLQANESEVHLTHLYTVHNLGPSPFPYGQLIVTLPKTPYMWLRDVKVRRLSIFPFLCLSGFYGMGHTHIVNLLGIGVLWKSYNRWIWVVFHYK